MRALEQASQSIALLRAANFSIGVAVLTRLVTQAAALLSTWDLDIVDIHHRHKRDAPSGTALRLAHAAESGLGRARSHVTQEHHDGSPRPPNTIGFASVRAGSVVGEHDVLFHTEGERLTLTHQASDRGIFARGALQAARWLRNQPPGLYDLDDMLARPLVT